MIALLLAGGAAGWLTACFDDGGIDAGPDAHGVDDGGSPDGGSPDSGSPDGGEENPFDAGLDGGARLDGGDGPDAGAVDAGPPCPVPMMAPLPVDDVSFSVLTLDATASSAVPPSTVVGWQWSVTPPRLLAIPIQPNPLAAVASYMLSVSGTYQVELSVTDSAGRESCAPAQHSVTVVPQHDLQVEITWVTPGDPDVHDMLGADLDVHLLMPLASRSDDNDNGLVDGYFSTPFDVHWLNAHYTNFTPELEDDVQLYFDDTNGAGPEIIAAETLQPDLGYRVGVHYFNDRGFGPSELHVDVWVGGIKAVSIDRTLTHQQFWDVAELVPAGPDLIDQVVNGITGMP